MGNVITIEISSGYQKTHKAHCPEILNILYPDLCDDDEVIYRVVNRPRKGGNNLRAIKIFYNEKIEYIVGFSNAGKSEYDLDIQQKNKNDYHSNSYLAQGIAKILLAFFEAQKENPEVQLKFYLLGPESANTAHLVEYYRILQTLGWDILNIRQVDFIKYCQICEHPSLDYNQLQYSNIQELCNDKIYISLKQGNNIHNVPSYITPIDDENIYWEYHGKVLSSNGYETMLDAMCIDALAKQEGKIITYILDNQYFNFYGEQKKTTSSLTGPAKQILNIYNINFDTNASFINSPERLDYSLMVCIQNKDYRDQLLYRKNMKSTGIIEQSAISGLTSNIEYCHLWQVKDINKATQEEINLFYQENPSLGVSTGDLHQDRYNLVNHPYNGICLCKGKEHADFDHYYYNINGDGSIVIPAANGTKKIGELNEDALYLLKSPQRLAFLAKRKNFFELVNKI